MSSTRRFGHITTRTQILDATWQLIEEYGKSPSLVAIAQKAGVSRQAVYLHFGDRTGLLVALIEHMNLQLGKESRVREIFDAPTGLEVLDRLVDGLSVFTARVDKVARVFEVEQYQDDAVAAAWRNVMSSRREQVREVIRRIAKDKQLAAVWTIASATDLCHCILMPGQWRELVHHLGWSPKRYAKHVKALLRRGLSGET